MVSFTRTYVPADNIAFRVIDGQVVIVVPIENRMLTLNTTGSALWKLLDGRPMQEAVAALESTLDVEPEQLHQDVVKFIEEMMSRQLLVCQPE